MAERRPSTSDDDESYILISVDGIGEKKYLKDFILLYESCQSLWNPKDKYYLNPVKKNKDLDKLLQVYKNMKPNATRDDVKKKINSLRSNYRKELRKIENSKRSGIGGDEVYKPTSTTFHLLKFLAKIEAPKPKKTGCGEPDFTPEKALDKVSSPPKSIVFSSARRKGIGKLKRLATTDDATASVIARNWAIAQYYEVMKKQEEVLGTLKKRKLELEILELENKIYPNPLHYRESESD